MGKRDLDAEKIASLRARLLEWYQRSRRDLPWRRTRAPYAIWVSEIMLQQTRVTAVVDRYQAFIARFPTLPSLALATEDDVLALWSGLGYYRRARMLRKAAQFVVAHNKGNLPLTAAELRLLPGIGAYTAAAIASIAHGEPVAVVDGNVERVLCRLQGWKADSSQLQRKIKKLAGELLDPKHPGDFNQAMMELGATLCLPRHPQCLVCPLAADCKTQGEHKTAPRSPMISREVAHALSLRTRRRAGNSREEVLLEQRPASLSVMPGLWQLPALIDSAVPEEDLRLTVRHAIMNVNYIVRIQTVAEGEIKALTVAGGLRRWVPVDDASAIPLTGLARKVLTRLHLLSAAPRQRLPHGRVQT